MNHKQSAVRTTLVSTIANVLLAALKWLSGYFGNSYALIADAIESTADIFSSLLVLFGLKYSSRPADKNHPYGHGRAETLVTFAVVAFLMISAIIIAFESIKHIGQPHELPKPYTLFILGAIILWKELSYRFVIKKSKETHSSSLKAEAWHHRSDAITSIAAFIGISIALTGGKGYESADDWAALFSSGFIIYNSYLIFRPALGEMMDEHQHDDLITDIRQISSKVKGIVATEKCHVRKTGMTYYVDLHAMVDGNITVRQGHIIAHQLKDALMSEIPELGNVLVHIEPASNKNNNA